MTNDKAIVIIDNEKPHCGKRITFTEEEKCEAFEMAIEALRAEPCDDVVSRDAVHNMLENVPIGPNEKWFNWLQKACLRLAELPPVTPKPLDSAFDKIRAEIERKCDRINSLASALPYTAHREIQELLCEIMDLCKAESEDKECED